ncbi:hypothetical protein cypCar_00027089 [Cyprinus carpio]|nr:hypothetical protein cypCar_00027089 [Cyprinus carpio]
MDDSYCIQLKVFGDESLRCWKNIGSGGFGEVYRAKHTTLGMDVAIKLLHYKHGRSSIQREAHLMFQGGNPNVIRILGLYEGHVGSAGLVMEFMPKGSVADLLQTLAGPPPWPLTFRMAHEISLGMNFLHHLSPPLLHLDLKPSNVLLDDSLRAKASHLHLTDFGLSRVARSVSRCSGKKDEDEGGTLSYMPPEALQSINYKANKSSDVYRSRSSGFVLRHWTASSTGNCRQLHKTHEERITSSSCSAGDVCQNNTGGIQITMSNVCGVQIGNNNIMNIVQKQRRRHQTAPSRVGTSYSHSENSPKKPQ